MNTLPHNSNEEAYYILLGLIYGRGNLLGPGENCAVLYFTLNEIDFAEKLKELFPENSRISEISLKNDPRRKINGLYFVRKIGKELIRIFSVSKDDLKNRTVPEKILQADERYRSLFLSGWFSVAGRFENRLFGKVFKFTESNIETLNLIAEMLDDFDIKYNIVDNSDKKVHAFGIKMTKASEIHIKNKQIVKLTDVIPFIKEEHIKKV